MILESESISHVRRLDYYEDFGALGTILMIAFFILWISTCVVIIRRCLMRQRILRELSQNNPNGTIALVGDGRVITVIPISNNGGMVQGVPVHYATDNQNPANYYSPSQPYEEEPTYLSPTIAEIPSKPNDIVSVNP